MSTIAILYFSGYGHTERLAHAVQAGVDATEGANARMMRIDADGNLPDGAFDELADADAIVFGTPTYMGGPAWQFKKVADASSKAWFTRSWKDKVAAGFTNSASLNGDKATTMQYLFTLAQQHGQIWVGLGQLPSNALAAGPDDVNWAGGSVGLMGISPSDASPDQAPRKGDLETARLLGARVAEVALRFAAAKVAVGQEEEVPA